jgi:hypothetical protein
MTSPEIDTALPIFTDNLIGIRARIDWCRPALVVEVDRDLVSSRSLSRTGSKIRCDQGRVFDIIAGKVTAGPAGRCSRCQPTRCAPQAGPDPVSSWAAYPQRKPGTGNVTTGILRTETRRTGTRRESRGYRPSPALRHLIQVRNPPAPPPAAADPPAAATSTTSPPTTAADAPANAT